MGEIEVGRWNAGGTEIYDGREAIAEAAAEFGWLWRVPTGCARPYEGGSGSVGGVIVMSDSPPSRRSECQHDERLDHEPEMIQPVMVSRPVVDGNTCYVCSRYAGGVGMPPHDDCVSESGCRCVAETRWVRRGEMR